MNQEIPLDYPALGPTRFLCLQAWSVCQDETSKENLPRYFAKWSWSSVFPFRIIKLSGNRQSKLDHCSCTCQFRGFLVGAYLNSWDFPTRQLALEVNVVNVPDGVKKPMQKSRTYSGHSPAQTPVKLVFSKYLNISLSIGDCSDGMYNFVVTLPSKDQFSKEKEK